MTPTHEDILTAIEAAHHEAPMDEHRQVHCADLLAVMAIHRPYQPYVSADPTWTDWECAACRWVMGVDEPEACESREVAIVIARLQSWGYLTERTEP